ncbi:MAG: MarR family transcriptional regulator [Candidatus Omnitrophota bacterium]|nr:MarR family transcriptional regulator [Candidatus Omnitrophota bacterium]
MPAKTVLSKFADELNNILPNLLKEFHRRQPNELYKGEITLQQYITLNFLSCQNDATMGAIAKCLCVSLPAATGVVDRLIRDGYSIRRGDPKDRRIIRVKITPKGKKIVKKISRQRKNMIIKAFGKISAEEREQYLNILKKVGDALRNEKA